VKQEEENIKVITDRYNELTNQPIHDCASSVYIY